LAIFKKKVGSQYLLLTDLHNFAFLIPMLEEVRQAILEVIETALEAQLGAIRKLRHKASPSEAVASEVRRSQLDIVQDILLQAGGQPLHVSEIIKRAQNLFGQRLDRESLVSALTKRVVRGDRFVRTAPNTFALLAAVRTKEE
jgi:hypothetical protein